MQSVKLTIQQIKTMIRSKKGMIGWQYVVALVIGVFLLLVLIYIASKSGQTEQGLFDRLNFLR